MNIEIIKKLIVLQESKISALRKDYQTLFQVTEQLDDCLKAKQQDQNELAKRAHATDGFYFADAMLNTSLFLKQKNEEIANDISELNEAVKQKDAALDDLNDALVELRVLEKVVDRADEATMLEKLSEEQKDMDLTAMTQYNREVA